MTAQTLRPYQVAGIAALRASLASGYKAPVFVLATGGGKTAVAAELCKLARAKGRKVMFIAPRRSRHNDLAPTIAMR